MGKKKKMPGLNTSSTADISFMLLIFFLVTTSMDTDKGLTRRLPPPPENQEQNAVQINERNIFKVNINSVGQIMTSGAIRLECTPGDLLRLREMAKDFIKGLPHPGENQPPERSMVNVPGLGPTLCSDKHVISLQTDRGTPYAAYFAVQNELVAAYNELRDKESRERFGRPYEALNDDNKGAIREIYPQKISEAEPIDYSKLSH
ncbi:MAG: biopolymer transporter ExbD [Bacteroidales bacterium]|nr:biopolymer transporter ExbD [Candidatus Physcousia equi]